MDRLPAYGGKSSRLTADGVASSLGIDLSPSALVHIDSVQLDRIARQITARADFRQATPAKWDDHRFWNVEAPPDERSQYFTIGNAINFRFWHVEAGRIVGSVGEIDGEKLRGSMYMWRCLRRCIDQGRFPLLDARFLAQLTDGQFTEIFSDDTGRNPLIVGATDRVANLRDLGRNLLSRWRGRAYELLMESQGSLTAFAIMSKRIRAFDDPIYKLTMVNAILHSGSGVFEFGDDLLPGIDYEILKQLLRQRVVVPSHELDRKLVGMTLLLPTEAYELRRTALKALLELSRRTGIPGDILDNRYWRNRTNCTEDEPVCHRAEEAHTCPFYPSCDRRTDMHRPLELTRYY